MKPQDLYGIPAVATYVGTGLTAVSMFHDMKQAAVIVLCCLAAILVGTAIIQRTRYLKFKAEYEQQLVQLDAIKGENKLLSRQVAHLCKVIHKLSHTIRDYTTELRSSSQIAQVKDASHRATQSILDAAEQTFRNLTGSECVASVMLKLPDKREFETVHYSSSVEAERVSQRSDPLPADRGVIAIAMQRKKPVVWKHGDPEFVQIRRDFTAYYTRGIVTPFKVEHEMIGILNIDSLDAQFDLPTHSQAACGFADALGAIMESHNLWTDATRTSSN